MFFLKLTSKICLISFIFLSFLAKGQDRKLNCPYLSMFIPDGWVCVNFPPNHICHPKSLVKNKKILLVISARMGIKSDKLADYLRFQGNQGMREVSINSHKWFDFLSDNQMTGDYIRRRQATVCCDNFNYTFHTVVNFYVSRAAYPEYTSLIIRMINSLNLEKDIKVIQEMFKNEDSTSMWKIQDYIGNILSEEEESLDIIEKQDDSSSVWYLILIPVVVIPIFVFIKRRQKKRKLKALKRKLYRKNKSFRN